MKKLTLIKSRECHGCISCVTFCSQRNAGVSAPSRARIYVDLDPFTGDYKVRYCRQCKNAKCAEACPTGAITRNEDGGYLHIDYDVCSGCGECVEACTFGAMFWDAEADRPIKCENCDGSPICAQVCPAEALVWADPGELAQIRKGAASEDADEEYSLHPVPLDSRDDEQSAG